MKKIIKRLPKKWTISFLFLLVFIIPLSVKAADYFILKAEVPNTEGIKETTLEERVNEFDTRGMTIAEVGEELYTPEELETGSEGRIYEPPAVRNLEGPESIFIREAIPMATLTGSEKADKFDMDDEPGHDSSVTNNIVRSNDTIFYNYIITLDSVDKQEYKDIEIKIMGEIENGFSEDGRFVNAGFTYGEFSDRNSNIDHKKKKVTFDYTLKAKPTDSTSIATGSLRSFSIPIEIGGAANGTEIKLKVKSQIIKATDASGKVFDLSTKTPIVDLPGSEEPVIVSSKTSFKAVLNEKDLNTTFNEITNSTDDDYSSMMFAVLYLETTSIEGHKGLTGAAWPQGKIHVSLDQVMRFQNFKSNSGEEILKIGTNIRPMTIFDYGNVGSKPFENKMNNGYPNYNQDTVVAAMRNYTDSQDPYYPEHRYGGIYSSGDISVIETSDYQFNLTFENYSLNSPATRFATQGFLIRFPTEKLVLDSRMRYKINVTGLQEERKDGTIGTQSKLSSIFWERILLSPPDPDPDPPGPGVPSKPSESIRHTAKAGQLNEIMYSGDPLHFRNEISARYNYYTGAPFSVELIQKWNPKDSEVKSVTLSTSGEYRIYVDNDPTKGQDVYMKNKIVEPTKYGVSKSGLYDNATLNSNRSSDYTWYLTLEAAKNQGVVSAVSTGVTQGFSANDPILSQGDQVTIGAKLDIVRQFSNVSGNKDKDGNYYEIISFATVKNGSKIAYQTQGAYPDTGGTGDRISLHSFGLTGMTKKAFSEKTAEKIDRVNVLDVVDWELEPLIDWKVKNSTIANLRFTDTIPEGVIYVPGSAKFDGVRIEPRFSLPDGAGRRTLTWDVKATKGGKNKLTYKTSFDQYKFEFDILGRVDIWTRAGVKDRDNLNTSQIYGCNLILEKEQAFGIRQRVDKRFVDVGEEFTYELPVYNNTGLDLENISILDVLSKEKDDLGSIIHGSYKLTGLKVLKNDRKTPHDTAAIYFMNQDIDRNTDPSSIEGSSDWLSWTQSGIGPMYADAKAVYANIPSLPNGDVAYIQITIKPLNNEPSDIYANTATANNQTLSSMVYSSKEKTTVSNRFIKGTAWYDTNFDGDLGALEGNAYSGSPEFPVALYSVDQDDNLTRVKKNLRGDSLVDAAGKSTIFTKKVDFDPDNNSVDPDGGTYYFDALPAGNYVVGFDIDSVKEEKLFVTPIGSEAKGNKVSKTEKKDDYYLTPIASKINLPTQDKMTDNVYEANEINVGVATDTKITLKTEVVRTIRGPNIDGKAAFLANSNFFYKVTPTSASVSNHGGFQFYGFKATIPEGLQLSNIEGGVMGAITYFNGTYVKSPARDENFVSADGRTLEVKLKEPLGPGYSFAIIVYAPLEASGTFKNTTTGEYATVTSDGKREVKSNDTTVLIDCQPTLTKVADVSEAKLGDTITFKLTATNPNPIGSYVGAGNWLDVKITDSLPSSLQYVPNSTILTTYYGYTSPYYPVKTPVSDSGIWLDNKLTYNAGNITSNTFRKGNQVELDFKAKVVALPAKGSDIVNTANAVGKNADETIISPNEAKSTIKMNIAKVHLRQTVIEPEGTLMSIPSKGYFEISNKASDVGAPSSMTSHMITSSNSSSVDTITESLFTTMILPTDKPGIEIKDLLPEYYEYYGSIVTKNEEDLSTHSNYSEANKAIPFLEGSSINEYWVTVFIKQKFGTDAKGQQETAPRHYSWDSKLNEFGSIATE